MNNPYEAGKQKIIGAVLLYAFYQDKILFLHARGKDQMPSKWNGLGGKLEFGESMRDAAVREFEEEAACLTQRDQWQWLGQLFFPHFKAHKNEDWWVNVYVTQLSEEQATAIPLNDSSRPEGTLHWISKDEVAGLDLWDGDLYFLPLVLSGQRFEGTFYYEKGKCRRHELTLLSASSQ